MKCSIYQKFTIQISIFEQRLQESNMLMISTSVWGNPKARPDDLIQNSQISNVFLMSYIIEYFTRILCKYNMGTVY
jgi:hypothetical protein